jgi:transcriptional regulator with XRE-family HTH domain
MDTGKLQTMILLAGLEGWTNKDIAEKAEVNVNTVSRIMTGKTRQIKPDTLNKFAKAFGVEAKDLI